MHKHTIIRVAIVLFFVISMLSLNFVVGQATSQDLSFKPVTDAYVNANNPKTNYGSDTTLQVEGPNILTSFIRFRVSGLSGRSITRAILKFYASNTSSSGVVARSVADNNWNEKSITYANQPAQGAILATSAAASGGSWTDLDVTAYVKGQGSYSFGISTSGSDLISFGSSESGSSAPQLVLTVSDTASAPTVPIASTATAPSAPTATKVATATSSSIVASSLTLLPATDAYVNASSPSTNYGSATTLQVYGSPILNSFIRFNVPALNGASLTSAKLRLYAVSASSIGVVVKSVADNSWSESTITYANQPVQGASLAASSAIVSGSWTVLDVTAYVKGQGAYSFGISASSSALIAFSSSESGSSAPQLVLSLNGASVPAPTAAPTLAPANTPAPTSVSVPSSSGSGNVYYVSTTGNDANPGSLASPWKTVQKAADTLVAGDTVLIRGGTYASVNRIVPRNSGTSGNYITYKAYPGERPEIITDAAQGFWLNGTSTAMKAYIELNGLTITARDVPFTTESCGTGILAEYSHHIRILNNVVRNSGGAGISIETGSDYATIQGNVVYGNTWGCSSWRGSGINLHRIMWYDQAGGYHNIVSHNLVYHNYHNLTYVLNHSDGNGFIVDESNDVNASGINPPILIENNIAFDNAGVCFTAFRSSNTTFRNNTCYHNLTDPYEKGDEEITITSSTGIQVYNNILVASGVDATSAYNSTNITMDYNLAYGGNFQVGGTHNIIADPLLVNPTTDPATADFHLKAGSPAIDRALGSQSPSVDYAGRSRPQGGGYDIGAYEY